MTISNKQIKRLLRDLKTRRNIMEFKGSGFRRIVYPQSVRLCYKPEKHGCDAMGDCCHKYEVEGISFCIDYGVDQYGGNEDYICEKDINGKWVEVDKEVEVKETERKVGW